MPYDPRINAPNSSYGSSGGGGVPIPAPLAFWHMETTNNITDETGNGNTLTATGAVAQVPGLIGNGTQYNSDAVSNDIAPGPVSFNAVGKAFSLQAWLKVKGSQITGVAGSTPQVIMSFHDTPYTDIQWSLRGESGSIATGEVGGKPSVAIDETDSWKCIQAVIDDRVAFDGKIRIRVNGGAWDSDTFFFLNAPSSPVFKMGGLALGGSAFFCPWPFDNMGIWDVELTDEEFDWLYNSGSGRNYPFT